jgi:nascent polypeptide-associated complex subunit alpha
MFGNIDPKKIQGMMKQMGIAQEAIDAERVIIEKSDGSKTIIENPSVMKIKMQGQVNFQISGDIIEKESVDSSEDEGEKMEEDLQTIIDQTGVTKEEAAIELEKNNGDMAETIIALTKKK